MIIILHPKMIDHTDLRLVHDLETGIVQNLKDLLLLFPAKRETTDAKVLLFPFPAEE